MNMASNCDVTNSAHQIQMITVCWMKPPQIFCVHHYKGMRNETQGSRQQPIRGIK